MEITYYTDGAVSGNGKENARGGWAYVRVADGVSTAYGSENNTTNQRMELSAAIAACHDALTTVADEDSIIIVSDSAYLINCKNCMWYKAWQRNGWRNAKKQPVANMELWEELIPYFENSRFTFRKVKGHTNSQDADAVYNAMADSLAVVARG